MFRVTRDWINSNRTPRGAFTRVQVEALGLEWNQLVKGWIRRVDGTEITEVQKLAFEAGKMKKVNVCTEESPTHVDHAVATICAVNKLNDKHRSMLLNKLFPKRNGS